MKINVGEFHNIVVVISQDASDRFDDALVRAKNLMMSNKKGNPKPKRPAPMRAMAESEEEAEEDENISAVIAEITNSQQAGALRPTRTAKVKANANLVRFLYLNN